MDELDNSTVTLEASKTETSTNTFGGLTVETESLDSSVASWSDYVDSTSGNSSLTIVDECYF